jgi:hypothetical protein
MIDFLETRFVEAEETPIAGKQVTRHCCPIALGIHATIEELRFRVSV